MIYEHFRVTGTHEADLDFFDLFGISLHGDDVHGFDTRGTIHQVLPDDMFETLL